MTTVQKAVPAFVMVVILLAVGWVLIPFEFAQGVKCDAPLLGGDAKTTESVGLIIPELDCKSKARSRLLTSAMIALAAAGLGTAAIALQPLSPQCYGGNHDECSMWWGNLLSDTMSGFGCQCSCHEGDAL